MAWQGARHEQGAVPNDQEDRGECGVQDQGEGLGDRQGQGFADRGQLPYRCLTPCHAIFLPNLCQVFTSDMDEDSADANVTHYPLPFTLRSPVLPNSQLP